MMASFSKYLSFLPGLWKHRRLGFLTTLALGILGAIVIAILPNRYEASARAYVDTQSILRPLMEGMAVQPDVNQQLSMMSRALLSRANVLRVAEDAGMLDKLEPGQSTDKLVDGLRKKIQFEPAGRENFFSLKYRDGEPEVALSVVSSLLEIFFNSARSDQERDTRQAVVFLDEQIKVYEKRLIAAENALKEFKVNNLEVMPNLQQDYFAQTAKVQQAQQAAQLELQQTLNARAALRAQLAGVPQSFSSADPRAGGVNTLSELQKRLRDAEDRLGDLRMRYTEQHPDVQNTARIVKDLQAAREAEKIEIASNGGVAPGQIVIPNRVFQDLKVSLASTDAQVASLRARVADANRRLASVRTLAKTVPEVEAQYKQLNRDYEVNKTTYEQLVSRRESALLSGNLDATSGAGDFRVVDPPKVSTSPVWPNRPFLLILVCLASLAAGLFAALVRSQSSPAFYDVYSLRSATDVPVFGSVSYAEGANGTVMSGLSTFSFWLLVLGYIAAFVVAIGLLLVGKPKEPEPASQFSQSSILNDYLTPSQIGARRPGSTDTSSNSNRSR